MQYFNVAKMLLLAVKVLKFQCASGCISLKLNGFFFVHLFLCAYILSAFLEFFLVLLSYYRISSNLHWEAIHIHIHIYIFVFMSISIFYGGLLRKKTENSK